jgi:hypothetical protein
MMEQLGFIKDSEYEGLYRHPDHHLDFTLNGDRVSVGVNLEYTLFYVLITDLEQFLKVIN